jgi:RimJ/RimL family protein N-acetyltransferase
MTSRAKHIDAIELSTERFTLRPIAPLRFSLQTRKWTQDRQSFSDLAWRTSGWTGWRWWRHLRRLSRKKGICHGIWPNGASEPIGLHLAQYNAASGNVTVGVLIADRAWWGKDAVVEVRTAILADFFERIGAERATGWVQGRNLPSIYNYQRLGFSCEAVLRDYAALLDGTRADYLAFGLLRSEWRGQHNSHARKGLGRGAESMEPG